MKSCVACQPKKPVFSTRFWQVVVPEGMSVENVPSFLRFETEIAANQAAKLYPKSRIVSIPKANV